VDRTELDVTAPLTLWRGEQLLGRLLPRTQAEVDSRPDRPPTLSAFLVLSADAPKLEGVWQVHPFFGMGVQQDPIEAEIVGVRDRRPSKYPSSGALEPATPEQIAGVSREVQLTIRNEAGQIWMPRQISLREFRYNPEDLERARRDVPAEALINGSIWLVFAGFDSPTDAPAL
jgi:hypothetical protein